MSKNKVANLLQYRFWNKISFCAAIIAFVTYIITLAYIFYYSPDDYQQGAFVKIMYVHVPCAWLALMIYGVIGVFNIGYLIWRNQLLELVAVQAALPGFIFSVLTLVTGMLWGKPIWGTWWVWDARLTSMFILACLYLAYISLNAKLRYSIVTSNGPAILSIVGLVNLPIIKWSVNLWTTLHQPASIFRYDGPSVHHTMLLPLIGMFIATLSLAVFIIIIRAQTEINRRKILRAEYNRYSK